MKQHALFIGRYVPVHNGHIDIWRTKMDAGVPVCIAIRLTEGEAIEPTDRAELIRKALTSLGYVEGENFLLIFLPDINAVCYSRHVGYDIQPIEAVRGFISATNIRNIVANGGISPDVPEAIQGDLARLLTK